VRASELLLTGEDPAFEAEEEEDEETREPAGPLDFLNENPLFMRIRSEVAQNPDMLPVYLQRLKNTDENLYNLCIEHTEEFVRLVK
jgi:hypothetical protein